MEFCHFINRCNFAPNGNRPRTMLEDLLKAIGYETHLFDSDEPRAAESKWNNVREFVAWYRRRARRTTRTSSS